MCLCPCFVGSSFPPLSVHDGRGLLAEVPLEVREHLPEGGPLRRVDGLRVRELRAPLQELHQQRGVRLAGLDGVPSRVETGLIGCVLK